MTAQNFVPLLREVVEQLYCRLSSGLFYSNYDEAWALIGELRAALTEQVQPAHPPRVTQEDVNVCKSITEQLEELSQRTKEIDARYRLEPAQGEQSGFNAFYDTVCNRQLTVREIAEKCWQAALLQSNAEWVPLTDERILYILAKVAGRDPATAGKYNWTYEKAIARAIEAEIKKGQQ